MLFDRQESNRKQRPKVYTVYTELPSGKLFRNVPRSFVVAAKKTAAEIDWKFARATGLTR